MARNPEPQRSEQPRPLGASLVPLERALLARANAIEAALRDVYDGEAAAAEARAARMIAGEFRALADELRHW